MVGNEQAIERTIATAKTDGDETGELPALIGRVFINVAKKVDVLGDKVEALEARLRAVAIKVR